MTLISFKSGVNAEKFEVHSSYHLGSPRWVTSDALKVLTLGRRIPPKCLRQSIAQFPFVLETDFSFRGGLNRNRYKDGQNFSQIGPMVTEIWCCNLGLSHITGKCLTFFNPLFKSILVQKVWQSDKILTFFEQASYLGKFPCTMKIL